MLAELYRGTDRSSTSLLCVRETVYANGSL